jgi:ribonucleotide monophosphatase NagD (HAD superfamily)
MKTYFHDTDTKDLQGFRIFLDIDGTLLPHKEAELDDGVKQKLVALAKENELFIVSNKPMPERNLRIATLVYATAIIGPYKKPDKRILDDLPVSDKPTIVIGDKITTDGFFAWNIGAKYYPMRRVRDDMRDVYIMFTDTVDDVVNIFIAPIFFLFGKYYKKPLSV